MGKEERLEREGGQSRGHSWEIYLWRQLKLSLAGESWEGPTTEVTCLRSEEARFYAPALISHALRAALGTTSSLALLACSVWYLENDGRQRLTGAPKGLLVVMHGNYECQGQMDGRMFAAPVSLCTFSFFTQGTHSFLVEAVFEDQNLENKIPKFGIQAVHWVPRSYPPAEHKEPMLCYSL